MHGRGSGDGEDEDEARPCQHLVSTFLGGLQYIDRQTDGEWTAG